MEFPQTSVLTLTNATAAGPNLPAAHALDCPSSGALNTCRRVEKVSSRLSIETTSAVHMITVHEHQIET